jgi:voltage-gated potassium channel
LAVRGVDDATMFRMDEPMRERWEEAVDWPLTLAALAFLAAYAWPILDPDLPAGTAKLCGQVVVVTWVLFVIDYLVRLFISRQRWRFIYRNVGDLLVVALPVLRPLRLLRLLTLLSVLNRYAGDSLRGRVGVYVGGAASLVIFVAALAVLDAERQNPDANITSFGDALWWATTTVTTVGYGDTFPMTTTGRFIAAGLMLAGIALLGVVTASIASWLLERVQQIEEESEAATRRDVQALADEVQMLRERLDGRES